jgi:hypothetical protein
MAKRNAVSAARESRTPRLLARVAGAAADNYPAVLLAVIAFSGSLNHVVSVASAHGQHGVAAYSVAGCVDLLCVIGGQERIRDKKIGRCKKWGLVAWPMVVLSLGISLTIAFNWAAAGRGGVTDHLIAIVPSGVFLLAVFTLERRASHPVPATAAGDGRGSGNRQRNQAGTVTEPVPGTVAEPRREPRAELPAALPGTTAAVTGRDLALPAGEARPAHDGAGADGEGGAQRRLTDEEKVAMARGVYREFAGRGEQLTVAKLTIALGGGNKQRITEILRQVRAEAEAAQAGGEAAAR